MHCKLPGSYLIAMYGYKEYCFAARTCGRRKWPENEGGYSHELPVRIGEFVLDPHALYMSN